MCAILTNTIVIEKTPISLGLRIRERITLTKKPAIVDPDDEIKLITNDRRRFSMGTNT
jgi:hypothetical protein